MAITKAELTSELEALYESILFAEGNTNDRRHWSRWVHLLVTKLQEPSSTPGVDGFPFPVPPVAPKYPR